jgi:hypothetical protein
MTLQRKHFWSTALLLTAGALLQPAIALADNKHPPKPGLLLGSHPSKQAQTARLAILKQRTSAVPFKLAHSPKIANSLNHIPGKTITVSRKAPK